MTVCSPLQNNSFIIFRVFSFNFINIVRGNHFFFILPLQLLEHLEHHALLLEDLFKLLNSFDPPIQ